MRFKLRWQTQLAKMVSKFTKPNAGTIATDAEKLDGTADLYVFPCDRCPIERDQRNTVLIRLLGRRKRNKRATVSDCLLGPDGLSFMKMPQRDVGRFLRKDAAGNCMLAANEYPPLSTFGCS